MNGGGARAGRVSSREPRTRRHARRVASAPAENTCGSHAATELQVTVRCVHMRGSDVDVCRLHTPSDAERQVRPSGFGNSPTRNGGWGSRPVAAPIGR
jgi:hypothetical protein